MRPNLITRLKEEWNNLDPVDPLRGLIADAIDALAEQPASKPLTDDRIWELKTQFEKDAEMKIPEKPFRNVVRVIEAAHGIKGDA